MARGLFGLLLTTLASGASPLSPAWRLVSHDALPPGFFDARDHWWVFARIASAYAYTCWPDAALHKNLCRLVVRVIAREVTHEAVTAMREGTGAGTRAPLQQQFGIVGRGAGVAKHADPAPTGTTLTAGDLERALVAQVQSLPWVARAVEWRYVHVSFDVLREWVAWAHGVDERRAAAARMVAQQPHTPADTTSVYGRVCMLWRALLDTSDARASVAAVGEVLPAVSMTIGGHASPKAVVGHAQGYTPALTSARCSNMFRRMSEAQLKLMAAATYAQPAAHTGSDACAAGAVQSAEQEALLRALGAAKSKSKDAAVALARRLDALTVASISPKGWSERNVQEFTALLAASSRGGVAPDTMLRKVVGSLLRNWEMEGAAAEQAAAALME